jgi:hypothetical protein
MYLIQVFLPLRDKSGQRFPREHYESIERKLIATFTGFTAYPRAPASGLWKDDDEELERDELVIYEVMTEQQDKPWWKSFREDLERLFQQDKILVRSQSTELL